MTEYNNYTLSILTDDDPLWDKIRSNKRFSIYHQKVWKSVIENSFKHKGKYIAVCRGDTVIDLVPFYLVKNKILGSKLISTVYETSNGGFISDENKIYELVVEKAEEIGKRHKSKYIEFRSSHAFPFLTKHGYKETIPFIITELPLIDENENWKLLTKNHRRNVRIAQKKGVTVKEASDLDEMIQFYDILSKQYKNIGLPFFGNIFFKEIWSNLVSKDLARLLVAYFQDKIIGGHLLFYSGEKLISKYMAAIKDNEYKKMNTSYLLFWKAIQLGVAKNFSYFDMGITGRENAGLIKFKQNFGGQHRDVYFYFYKMFGHIPDYEEFYNSYKIVKLCWKKSPDLFTSIVGHEINKWLC
jgi:hypothetical protein